MSTARPLVERVLAGRYRIVEPIGGGGTSLVFHAEVVGGGPDVAIKQLRPAPPVVRAACPADPVALAGGAADPAGGAVGPAGRAAFLAAPVPPMVRAAFLAAPAALAGGAVGPADRAASWPRRPRWCGRLSRRTGRF